MSFCHRSSWSRILCCHLSHWLPLVVSKYNPLLMGYIWTHLSLARPSSSTQISIGSNVAEIRSIHLSPKKEGCTLPRFCSQHWGLMVRGISGLTLDTNTESEELDFGHLSLYSSEPHLECPKPSWESDFPELFIFSLASYQKGCMFRCLKVLRGICISILSCRVWQAFSLKGQVVNILGFAWHMVSIGRAQLCHCLTNAARDNT